MPAGEFSIARRARGGAKSGGGPEVPLVRAPSIWGMWSTTSGRMRAKDTRNSVLKSGGVGTSVLSRYCSDRTAHLRLPTPTHPLSSPEPNFLPGVFYMYVTYAQI